VSRSFIHVLLNLSDFAQNFTAFPRSKPPKDQKQDRSHTLRQLHYSASHAMHVHPNNCGTDIRLAARASNGRAAGIHQFLAYHICKCKNSRDWVLVYPDKHSTPLYIQVANNYSTRLLLNKVQAPNPRGNSKPTKLI
jgi:hypothetical protein